MFRNLLFGGFLFRGITLGRLFFCCVSRATSVTDVKLHVKHFLAILGAERDYPSENMATLRLYRKSSRLR